MGRRLSVLHGLLALTWPHLPTVFTRPLIPAVTNDICHIKPRLCTLWSWYSSVGVAPRLRAGGSGVRILGGSIDLSFQIVYRRATGSNQFPFNGFGGRILDHPSALVPRLRMRGVGCPCVPHGTDRDSLTFTCAPYIESSESRCALRLR